MNDNERQARINYHRRMADHLERVAAHPRQTEGGTVFYHAEQHINCVFMLEMGQFDDYADMPVNPTHKGD